MTQAASIGMRVALALLAFAPAHGRSDAGQILRKAEAVRNPDLDYAVDFAIHGVARGARTSERDATYSMLARGKDRTVILMRSPSALYGALVLMAEGQYWMLLPRASNPWELSGAQMKNGDIATGNIARVNLTRGFSATVAGEERIEGEACWRLELLPVGDDVQFARIAYWVAKKGFLPKRLDQYGSTGTLLKSVRYLDYRKGALGLRPMRLTIDSMDEWKEASSLTFSNLRKISPPSQAFTPEGMIALRDAALAAQSAAGAVDVSLERILGLGGEPLGVKPAR